MANTTITAVALIVAIALGAGCGNDGDTESALAEPGVRLDTPVDQADPEADNTEDNTADTPSRDGSDDGAVDLDDTTGTPRPVIAAATISSSGVEDEPVDLAIDVYQLERNRDAVQLEFEITNNGPGDYRPSIHFGATSLAEKADGLSLIDYADNLRYLTLVDETGDCVCSGGLLTDVGVGDTFTVTASFPAPPAGATVDIVLGTLGVVPNVAVTDA